MNSKSIAEYIKNSIVLLSGYLNYSTDKAFLAYGGEMIVFDFNPLADFKSTNKNIASIVNEFHSRLQGNYSANIFCTATLPNKTQYFYLWEKGKQKLFLSELTQEEFTKTFKDKIDISYADIKDKNLLVVFR